MNGFCPSSLTMSAPVLSLGLQRLMAVVSTKLTPAALSPVLQRSLQMPASPHPSPDSALTDPSLPSSQDSSAHLLEPAPGCLLGQQQCFPKAAVPHTLHSCRLLSRLSSLHIPCKINKTAYYILQSKRNKYGVVKDSRSSL